MTEGANTLKTLQRTIEQKDALRTDLAETQAKLAETDGAANAALELAHVNRQRLDEQRNELRLFGEGLSETNKNIAKNIQVSVDCLVGRTTELENRTEDLSKLLDDARKFADGTSSDLAAFQRACGMQRAKDERNFGALSATVNDNGNMLRETDSRVYSQAEHMRTTITMVRALKAKLEQAQQELSDVGRESAAMTKSFKDHLANEYGPLAHSVRCMDTDSEKNPHIVRLNKLVGGLGQELEDISTLVYGLDESCKDRESRLSDVEERLGGHVKDTLASHHNRLQALDDQVGLVGDNLGGAPQKKLMVNIEDRIKNWSISARQRRANEKIEGHAEEIGTLRETLSSTSTELAETKSELQSALQRLDDMTNKVSELGSGLDLTREYWQGLSRGFRDTHYAVAVQHSVLPPKTALNVTLPSIQKARTPGAAAARSTTSRAASGLASSPVPTSVANELL